jgi:hypothetical protein
MPRGDCPEWAAREETAESNLWRETDKGIARINRIVKGWIEYFDYASSAQVFDKMEWQMRELMR